MPSTDCLLKCIEHSSTASLNFVGSYRRSGNILETVDVIEKKITLLKRPDGSPRQLLDSHWSAVSLQC